MDLTTKPLETRVVANGMDRLLVARNQLFLIDLTQVPVEVGTASKYVCSALLDRLSQGFCVGPYSENLFYVHRLPNLSLYPKVDYKTYLAILVDKNWAFPRSVSH
jgi:hypothetical protein